jgi:MFS family permease
MQSMVLLVNENAVYRKVTRRIVPLIVLAYTSGYLARINIGIAKLQMSTDMHFSNAVYGLGAGTFFAGYLLFEIPSNLLLYKIGARRSISRIMILWGFSSAAMMFISSAWTFYILRFLLGAAEAGFFPGIVLYLTYWYPSRRRTAIAALFMASIPISGIIGGPVSGWLMTMSGWRGLPGWRWMFLFEVLPSILIGILVLFVMDDGFEDAKWLELEEKSLLRENLKEQDEVVKSPKGFLGNPYFWQMAGIYFFITSAQYGVTFWLPSLIRSAGVKDVLQPAFLR